LRHRLTGKVVGGVAVANVWPAAQNFQSLFGITSPTVIWPLTVSLVCVVSVAPDWSAAGKYGIGLPMTFSGWPFMPLRLMMRPRTMPVVPVRTGVFTHSFKLGDTAVSEDAFAGTTVGPALSPCQPLLIPMSPCARRSLEM